MGITDKIYNVWKYTPLGALYNKFVPKSTMTIHVTNRSSRTIMVVEGPNKDWQAADLGTSVAFLVVSLGTDAPAGFQAAKSLKGVWDVIQLLNLLKAAGGVTKSVASTINAVIAFFQKHGTTIEPGKTEAVFVRGKSNPFNYGDPSQYGAVGGGSDRYLIIVDKSLEWRADFNTNSDKSWVVMNDGVHEVVHGTLVKPKPGGRKILWTQGN